MDKPSIDRTGVNAAANAPELDEKAREQRELDRILARVGRKVQQSVAQDTQAGGLIEKTAFSESPSEPTPDQSRTEDFSKASPGGQDSEHTARLLKISRALDAGFGLFILVGFLVLSAWWTWGPK